jgi:hypothetical protein
MTFNSLLGMSPENKPFNEALWYAFTEILDGDCSKINAVNLTPRREVPRSNGTPLSDGMKGG